MVLAVAPVRAAILAPAVAPVAAAILAPAVARVGGAVVWLMFGYAGAARATVVVRVAGSNGRNAARAAGLVLPWSKARRTSKPLRLAVLRGRPRTEVDFLLRARPL